MVGGTSTDGGRIHLFQLISSRSETVDGRAEKSANTSLAAFLKRSPDAEKRSTDMDMNIERRC
ncbi:hypothetical protein I7I48_04809 [Histoplasma ohiense]|nr:hypothetical protein I7I48_04809 [Histoplasma ohiense (nom. inval.)]